LRQRYINFNPGDTKMRFNYKTALMLVAIIGVPLSAAYAAGLYPNYPLVGGAAVCSSTSTGVSGQVCTTTTPAGPTIVTGSETTAWDTNLSQGRSPQTVRLGMASMNALPWTFTALVPSAATLTQTTLSTQGGLMITGAASLTPSIGVILPPSPVDGQQFGLSSNVALAALNVVGSGSASVSAGPTSLSPYALGAPVGYKFIYHATNTTWYRAN